MLTLWRNQIKVRRAAREHIRSTQRAEDEEPMGYSSILLGVRVTAWGGDAVKPVGDGLDHVTFWCLRQRSTEYRGGIASSYYGGH